VQWSEQVSLELGVEGGDADSIGRARVEVGADPAFDEAVEAEATRVIAHLRRSVILVGEPGCLPAKALVGWTDDGVDDETQGADQRRGMWIPEAKRSDSFGTALIVTFDHKEPLVDLRTAPHDLGQLFDPGEDADVVGLLMTASVCGPLFEVLLHVIVLVGEVGVNVGARRKDPPAAGSLEPGGRPGSR
jgi:hypothetical protein